MYRAGKIRGKDEGYKWQIINCVPYPLTGPQECRLMGVECIVAPYEADAQLAFLEKASIVDLVITEDSDLLAFGCKRVRPWHYLP